MAGLSDNADFGDLRLGLQGQDGKSRRDSLAQVDSAEAHREVSRCGLGGDQLLVLCEQFSRCDASAMQQAESLGRNQNGSGVKGGRIGFVHMDVSFG